MTFSGLSALLVLLAACESGNDNDGVIVVPTPTPSPSPTASPTPGAPVAVPFSFEQNIEGWQPVFADYPADRADQFELRGAFAPVPANLQGRNGLLLSSINRSDDVFMGAYHRIERLEPNTMYKIEAKITVASNSPAGCAGVGGAPGEALTFKAGASTVEPKPSISGFVQLPLSKGNQATSGSDMVNIGDLATDQGGQCATEQVRYVRKDLDSAGQGPTVRSGADGSLWVIMGTDSGFEGLTTFYLLEGTFTLTAVR